MKLSWGNKTIGLVLAVALAAIGFLALRGGSGEDGKVGKVTRQDLVQRVTIAGNVVSKRRTLVTAPYNGYVRQIFVKVGDQVKPGQALVSVAQSLQSSEPVFPLRAPYAGTVMHVQKHEGEYVKEGDPQDYILRIDDLSKLYVQASAPEVDRVKLTGGLDAVIKASAVPARSYKGKIDELTLAPQMGQQSSGYSRSGGGGEYPVRIEITDPDAEIGPGMSTLVDIITKKAEKLLTLRHEFVLRGDDGFYAILLNGKRRKIETGLQNEEVVEIRSGLSENEEVRQVDFTQLTPSEDP
ncbi:MAG TPA: efflux RND transporter periplasmic adaptor subunit [Bdellovibrionota bacterium]|jgi:multidrug efflux pump subunit AcrA (membrane-fusion protein)